MFLSILSKGILPDWMAKRSGDKLKTEYMKKMLGMFGISRGGMPFIKKKSIENQFYYDLITPLEEKIFVEGTTIHIFYVEKMGNQYLERYNKHFANPHIVNYDLQHEELLVCYPEKWAEEVKHCCFG